MTTTAHVAPEEVMAWVDGELAADEAVAVAAHVEECAECAGVAAQFRGMSEQLAGWRVEEVPARVEAAVMERAATGGRRSPIRRGGWHSGRWVLGMGGAVAAGLVLLAVVPSWYRMHQAMPSYQVIDGLPQSDALLRQPREGLTMPATDAPSSATTDARSVAGHAAPAQATSADKQLAESRTRSEGKGTVGQLVVQRAQSQVNGYLTGASTKGGGGVPSPVVEPAAVPMIARSVSLTVRVKDVEAGRAALEAMMARHHGYAAQMNANTAEGAARGFTASLRIPATELAAALKEFRTLGRVENESQSGEEVTQQHEDLVARLKTARDTEARFQGILRDRTGSVSDVLEVEQEIARVRGEIESMEAEQAGLERRVDFASVEVSLVEEYKAEFGAPAESVGTRVRNAFVAGYRNAGETVLGMVLFVEEYGPALVVWLVVLGLPVVWVWRRYRRMLRA